VTLFNSAQQSPQQIVQLAQARLLALLRALNDIDDFYKWLSAQADLDLTGIGFSATDLGTLRSAVADAHALVQLFESGTLPGTYTLPYTFGASQRLVLGPNA
jgi:hypothetical protein